MKEEFTTVDPFTLQPGEPTDDLTDIIAALKIYDVEDKSLQMTRTHLNKIVTLSKKLMADTSTKEYSYDEQEVSNYIDSILSAGNRLKATKPSQHPQFEEIQKLRCFSDLISERVNVSLFGTKLFRVKELSLLRNNIQNSKTLHELRQAVKLIIGPLKLWREHAAMTQALSPKQRSIENKETDGFIDSILLELEEANRVSADRKRVIDLLAITYEPDANGMVLLRAVEATKANHNISDTEAAGIHGISRGKLLSLRANSSENLLDSSQGEQVQSLRNYQQLVCSDAQSSMLTAFEIDEEVQIFEGRYSYDYSDAS